MRADFVGIAPQVSGHIVDLRVRDNQQVREGDLLFVVDARPYEIAVARARANLALTRKEVEGLRNGVSTADAGVARATAQLDASAADVVRRETDPVAADAEIARLEAQRVASEAALHRANAEFRNADSHLARLEPLLPEKFVTEDKVDEARTRRVSAAMAAEQARTSVLAAGRRAQRGPCQKASGRGHAGSHHAPSCRDRGRTTPSPRRTRPGGRRRSRSGSEHERARRRGGGRAALRPSSTSSTPPRDGRRSPGRVVNLEHFGRGLRAERRRRCSRSSTPAPGT